MNTSMFLPKEIKVGFQNRGGTYTGKLAYVVYFDERGKLRKEKSFESWRNQDIPTEEFNNEPTSGFVLNKKAGGYATGWNHRQTYVRIYDPRGFEFEISVENLLYILDNTSSIIGKGLEGEFVYAWSGSDLVLLPVNAPEYEELKLLNELRHKKEFVKAKELKVGATYLTKKNEKVVYLGKFDEYEHSYSEKKASKKEKKQFYFRHLDGYPTFATFPSISQKLIDVVDEYEHSNFAKFMDELECQKEYSPIDLHATVVETLDKDTFMKDIEEARSFIYVVASNGEKHTIYLYRANIHFEKSYSGKKNQYGGVVHEVNSIEDIYDILKPQVTKYYLANGRHYETEGFSAY